MCPDELDHGSDRLRAASGPNAVGTPASSGARTGCTGTWREAANATGLPRLQWSIRIRTTALPGISRITTTHDGGHGIVARMPNTAHSLRPASPPFPTLLRQLAFATVLAVLAGCSEPGPAPPSPAEVRARIVRLLPVAIPDRAGWATDIYAAFAALEIEPDAENVCSVLAVTEQESTFNPDPPVAGLGRIAVEEIEKRAERMGVPRLVVRGALKLEARDGRTWEERLRSVRTERELSEMFEELVDAVPLGRRLLAGSNPVRTGGPMQVGIAFAEAHVRDRPYPYAVEGSIRNEVFTRRGGMYFGIAHLLGYPASYERPIYRFADFNAGWYASRNAAFQQALSIVSGIPLTLDGDLVVHGSDTVGATETAARAIATRLDMSDAQIRRALQRSQSARFEDTGLYERVFDIAEKMEGRRIARAHVPHIRLQSPKITRRLTTEWFATRVDARHRKCMARAKQLWS